MPGIARTQQYVKEQLGQADEKVSWQSCRPPSNLPDLAYIGYVQTQLPPDYIELEKRVDALKQVHQKMLQVTCVQPFWRLAETSTDTGNGFSARNIHTRPMITQPTSANPSTT